MTQERWPATVELTEEQARILSELIDAEIKKLYQLQRRYGPL